MVKIIRTKPISEGEERMLREEEMTMKQLKFAGKIAKFTGKTAFKGASKLAKFAQRKREEHKHDNY